MTDPLADGLSAALGDRYRVEGERGRGGMARVYRALDLKHQRPVAIKVFRPELASVLGADRFTREIGIAALLNHPGIVPLFDSGAAAGLLYYVMPLVEGESLRDRLRREQQLPLDEAVRITCEVADALSYAHSRGVIHRDIKPENVLLESGHARVADFGIARALAAEDDRRITESGLAIGTPDYMSPEQAGGAEVDGRADIYSLGCVLYEMLAGDPPFRARTPQAVFALHALERPPSLQVVRPTVSTGVVWAIDRALAKAPADRFRTAGEFRDALLSASPAALPSFPLGQRASRRRWWIAGVAAAAVGAAALWPLVHHRTSPLDPRRVVVFPLVTGDSALAEAGAGWNVALAVGEALEHSQPLKGIDGWSRLGERERADPALVTPDLARSISRERTARYYVDGAIRRTERQTAVVLRLHDARADSLVSQESAVGSEAADVTSLALAAFTRLLPSLLEPGRPVDLSPLTDRLPGANALVIQGDRAYRQAQFATALDFYRRAIAEDSLHALAAVKGAEAADWVTHTPADDLLRIGLSHADLLPEKYRLFARGLAAHEAGWADSAVTAYRAALRIDPLWAEAWTALGETYVHLLPDAAPLDSLAEAALRHAREADSTFLPPLLHLTEMAIRRGALAGAREAIRHLQHTEADSTLVRQLSLMLDCVTSSQAPFQWSRAALDNAAAVVVAGKSLSVGVARPACAAGAFRAVLARPELSPGFKWAALVGLTGLLLAEGRTTETRAVLDSSIASGMTSARLLYLLGSLANAPFDDAAAEAAKVARDATGADYAEAQPETQFLLALWHARRGEFAVFRTVTTHLAERATATGQPDIRLMADALRAHEALLDGDTVGAMTRFTALRSVGPPGSLRWDLVTPLALERLQLAELQLTLGRFLDAYATATVFDHPGSIVFLPFLRRSLEIRVQAARAVGRRDLLDRVSGRLRALSIQTSRSQPSS